MRTSGESGLCSGWNSFPQSGLARPRPHGFGFTWLPACAVHFPNSHNWRHFLCCHVVPYESSNSCEVFAPVQGFVLGYVSTHVLTT